MPFRVTGRERLLDCRIFIVWDCWNIVSGIAATLSFSVAGNIASGVAEHYRRLGLGGHRFWGRYNVTICRHLDRRNITIACGRTTLTASLCYCSATHLFCST